MLVVLDDLAPMDRLPDGRDLPARVGETNGVERGDRIVSHLPLRVGKTLGYDASFPRYGIVMKSR